MFDRHWTVGSLLGETFRLFWRHAPLFLTITAVVVVPLVVAMEAASDAVRPGPGTPIGRVGAGVYLVGTLNLLLWVTVAPALVTALHVVALLRIAAGERPGILEALRLAARRALPALGATFLYMVAILAGLVFLIVPGIWLSVKLYFGAQAAVVDERAPFGALERSAELVDGRWWQTFGRLLLAGIVFALVGMPLDGATRLLDGGAIGLALTALAQLIVMSLTALFGTLVFMDYRRDDPRVSEQPAGRGGFAPPQPQGSG